MKKGYTRKTARILPGGKAAIPFGREYVSGAFSRWLNENERVDFGFPVQILTHFKEVVQRGGAQNSWRSTHVMAQLEPSAPAGVALERKVVDSSSSIG